MLLLILSNNTETKVKYGSTIFDIEVDPDQYEDMWNQLTPENLKSVKLTTESGDLIDQKENLVVDSENSFMEKDTVHCHFYLREKTEVELLREQVSALMESFSIRNEANNNIEEVIN